MRTKKQQKTSVPVAFDPDPDVGPDGLPGYVIPVCGRELATGKRASFILGVKPESLSVQITRQEIPLTRVRRGRIGTGYWMDELRACLEQARSQRFGQAWRPWSGGDLLVHSSAKKAG